jgi:nicotinamidase-related amidase
VKAFLIIDMQVGSFSNESPRFDSDGVVQRINTLSNHSRNQGNKIIFIQHDGTKEKFLLHGTSDWNILPTINQSEKDIYIEKTANDSFYRTDLETTLRAYSINELYIAGCATDFCVNSTVHSALVKDFNITVVKDCHTTADRPNFKAEELIHFHNWLWQNLTPTKGMIKLKALSEIIN